MVGQRIRYYRKVKGLTLEELSQGICSVSYLSKIEKAGAKSSDEVIIQLCERLGISPEEADNKEILDMLNEWNMMMVDRKFDQAKQFLKNVEEKMEGITNPELILRFELFLIRYYLVNNLYEQASKLLKKVKDFSDTFTPELEFYYYYLNSMNFYIEENYKQSLAYAEKAEAILDEQLSISEIEIAVLYYQIALSYSQFTRISSVNHYAYKAIQIFDKEYNYSRSADCQILIAISSRRIRNYELSEYHLNQALKYAESFNDKFLLGVIFHNLGFVSACKNDHQKAIDYLTKSFNLKKKEPLSKILYTVYLIALEYFRLGNLKESKTWLNKGLKEVGTNKQNEMYYHFTVLKHQIYGENKHLEVFLRKEAIPFFKEKNKWEYLADNAELLADLYFDQSQYKSASINYRIANEARKNIY